MSGVSNFFTYRFLLLLLPFCILFGLTAACSDSEPADVGNPLYVDPAESDFGKNPRLLKRILSGPHGYFRFINIPFSSEVCKRFAKLLHGTPSFNLHGDAHIEQYAVTDLGRGLTDFDDSSTGPAIIDLIRFGVSLHLACRAHGWDDAAPSIFDEFLKGYRAGLENPKFRPDEPELVRRLRKTFRYDRKAYFKWVASISEETDEKEKVEVRQAMKPYVESMRRENKSLAPTFFEIVDVNRSRIGIGSALDLKYLVRIKGETASPLDDVVLEIKQVRDLTGIDCITIMQKADPFRILLGQARIAFEPYKFLGYIRHRDLTFWVHGWVDNYKEFEIGKSARSKEELAEVAYDIGAQLGRGHTNQIAAPLDQQLREAQLQLLQETEDKIKSTCFEMTEQVESAWRRFRADAGNVD